MRNSKKITLFFIIIAILVTLALILGTIYLILNSIENEQKEGYYVHPEFVTEYTIDEHIERIKQRTRERFASEISSGEIVNFTVDIVYAFYDNDPEYFLVELEYKNEWTGKYANEDEWENGAGLSPENPNEFIYYTTKYKHLIGMIRNDDYYSGIWFYKKIYTPWPREMFDDDVWYMQDAYVKARESYVDVEFMDGRSAYSICGYDSAKKYYGSGIMAIEKNEQLVKIFDFDCLHLYVNQYEERFDNSAEFHTHYDGEICKSFIEEVINENEYKELMSEYTNGHKKY